MPPRIALPTVAACVVALVAIGLFVPAAGADLIAPPSKCQAEARWRAPQPRQEQAMRCLINHARRAAGTRALNAYGDLERAAGRKARDLSLCGFSHTACGRPADSWARTYGYTSGTGSWKFGENLAWGRHQRGSARRILSAWLNSPPHRATLLTGSFEHFGIGLRHGYGGSAAIWVLQLGCRGC
jgi:uncharacterized protein YkwD